MARSFASGRGGRRSGGRGSRVLTVREAPYSLPIQEPANFMELDFEVNGSGNDLNLPTLDAIRTALPTNTVKFRITSMVLDPCEISSGDQISVSNVNYELNMTVSGNHYESPSTNKPLRIKFSKFMGSDGQWYRNGGSQVTPSALGNIPGGSQTNMATMSIGSLLFGPTSSANQSISTDLHLRIAFTDD